MEDNFKIFTHKKREDYQTDFDRIAKIILNYKTLNTKKNSYRIREIEFYYSSAVHTDFYCHYNERQKIYLRLYFHRYNLPDSYVKLKRKGIDITIGNNENIYGGILIRAIENIKTKEILTGIGKLTNLIIEDIGGTLIIQDIYDSDKSIFDATAHLHLKTAQLENLPIHKKSRQNLNLKKEDKDRFYLDAKYNYFTYPLIETLK